MRKLSVAVLVVLCGVPILTQQFFSPPVAETGLCNVYQDVTLDYRYSMYDFCIFSYKPVALRSGLNFIYSPVSIWIMLAAIAEGADYRTQQKLFQLLSLPNDPCIRQAYYQLAVTRAVSSNDVNIFSTRVLMIDEGSTLNPPWYNIVTKNSLLEVLRAPIRYNPAATAEEIKRIMSARLPRLNLSGNSVLLDTMDYNGLWTTAFSDAVIERAPFYNQLGDVIGAVDLMRVQRRARMGYIKYLNAKILELPIGSDQRYRMLFGVVIGNGDLAPVFTKVNKEIVVDIFASLRESYMQIDVAIPRMVITSEVDVRVILEQLGVNELWINPAATRYISNPPALPTSYVQRSTVVFNNTGLTTEPLELNLPYSVRTGLEPILGRDFIADRPFLFGLFDAETYSPLLAGGYSVPTFSYV